MKKIIISFVLGMLLFSSAAGVYAGSGSGELPSITLTREGISTLLTTLRDWFAGIVVIIGIAMMLIGAFMFMTAAGDEGKVDKAKNTIIYGLVGVAVAILAYGVFTLVSSFLQ